MFCVGSNGYCLSYTKVLLLIVHVNGSLHTYVYMIVVLCFRFIAWWYYAIYYYVVFLSRVCIVTWLYYQIYLRVSSRVRVLRTWMWCVLGRAMLLRSI